MKEPIAYKKEQSLYIETARQKVIEVLFNYPDKEFSLTDLANEANVKKANIGKILDGLDKIGFIEIIKLKSIWRIKANQQNIRFQRQKIIYNLNLIYSTNFLDVLITYFNHPKAIILFGSFRRGEDISGSDIDIAIENEDSAKDKLIKFRELVEKDLRKEVIKFEEEIGRNIQVHLFNRKTIDAGLFNNIANGIVLSGFLEVRP